MKETARRLFLSIIAAAVLCPGTFAEEIDRVLVAVNGRIITESDLRLARNLNILLVFGRKDGTREASREEQLSRIIDVELIRQELESFPLEPGEQKQIEERVEELKGGYAEIGGIAPILRQLGLRLDELQSYLRLQASTMRFVNLRFRPFVSVSPEEIQTYYREVLLLRLKKAGAPVPPIGQVYSNIEEILTEDKVNTALDSWIKEIRSHSRIEEFGDTDVPATSPKTGSRSIS